MGRGNEFNVHFHNKVVVPWASLQVWPVTEVALYLFISDNQAVIPLKRKAYMHNCNTLPTLALSLDHWKSEKVTLLRRLCAGIVVLLVSGCASYGVIENKPMQVPADDRGYSVETFMEEWRTDENALMLAFSGGGTRAAALSYGGRKSWMRSRTRYTRTLTRNKGRTTNSS